MWNNPHVQHRKPVSERFWEKVAFPPCEDDCWLWIGGNRGGGYGDFWLGNRHVKAYRWAYEESFGPIPEGLTIDHLCRTPACVNPAHLGPVTLAVNTLRGNGPTAINARKTYCIHGHPFTEENTLMEGAHRHCRACSHERSRRLWAARHD